jgi:hypothetical protein
MSGQTPKVLSATTGAALLPNTGGSRFVFWVAVAALGVGLLTLAASGVASLKQRTNRA